MELDFGIALAGLPIGLIVGLTGMGGGALLTPMLVLGFGIDPLTAVSSDLVASLCMKPVGGAVHFKHGTVRTDVVRWLMLGSIPSTKVEMTSDFLSRYGISDREKDVIFLFAQGLGNKQIAGKLFISSSTVKNHITHIFSKTGMKSKIELLHIHVSDTQANPGPGISRIY